MTLSERRFLGVAFAWLVFVAYLADRGTDRFMRWQGAQMVELIEEVDDPPPAAGQPPDTVARENSAETGDFEPPPDNGPTLPPPLAVRISGPVEAQVGDMIELHAETTQNVTNFAWSIAPPVHGLLILDDGAKAAFSNRYAGQYLVIVSTANAEGQAAHATSQITIRPAPPENPLTLEGLAHANPPPDMRDLIRRWVNEVVSDNKAGETAAVAASLRQTANLLASGSLASASDPLYEVERAAEETMGPANFQKWSGTFFRRARDLLYVLNQRGYVVEPGQYANAFNNIAAELEEIAAGR